jgi:hypothetical protein
MRRLSGLWFVVLAIVSTLMSGCSEDTPTTPSSPSFVPFSGSYAGTVRPTANPLETFLDGTGSAVDLGQGTTTARVVILGVDGSAACPGGVKNEQHATLIAANGDTLSFTNHDVACPIGTAGLFHGTGHWYVTGGTGRFSGAMGQGTYNGQIDLARLTFSFNLSGTIFPLVSLR